MPVLYRNEDRERLRQESERRQTFVSSNTSHGLDPIRFAEAGFYYIGPNDTVSCFECGIDLNNWSTSANPLNDHRDARGGCRFVRGVICGNVPVGVDPSTIPLPTRVIYDPDSSTDDDDEDNSSSARSHDVAGVYDTPRSRDVAGLYDRPFPIVTYAAKNGEILTIPPAFHRYRSYGIRLRTYSFWPKHLAQKKEHMAEAGFFYTGMGDYVICYCCAISIKDWEPTDDPWEEHIKFNSMCYFLRVMKGNEYIARVFNKFLDINQPQEEEKNIDNEFECKICRSEKIAIVFLPCTHMIACTTCTTSITDNCPYCRTPIETILRPIICQ